MASLTLLQLQRRFKDLILASVEMPARREDTGIAASSLMDVQQRIEIYRRAYWITVDDALESTFPEFCSALDQRQRESLLRDYLAKYPLRHISINDVGRYLPEFVAETKWGLQRPWLVDLARYEWACHRADLVGDGEPFQFALLAKMNESELNSFVLRTTPSAQLLCLTWAVHEWEPPDEPEQRTCYGVVYTKQDNAQFLELTESQHGLLCRVSSGANLDALGDYAGANGLEASDLMAWFSQWSAEGLIVGSRFERP